MHLKRAKPKFILCQTNGFSFFDSIFQSSRLVFFMACNSNHAYNLWSFGQKITEMMICLTYIKIFYCIKSTFLCSFCSLWHSLTPVGSISIFLNGLHITLNRFFPAKEERCLACMDNNWRNRGTTWLRTVALLLMFFLVRMVQ